MLLSYLCCLVTYVALVAMLGRQSSLRLPLCCANGGWGEGHHWVLVGVGGGAPFGAGGGHHWVLVGVGLGGGHHWVLVGVGAPLGAGGGGDGGHRWV